MDTVKSGTTQEIAAFVAAAKADDFPREARDIGIRCLIDGIGVILAGSGEDCARIVRDYALSIGGRGESSLLGRGECRVPAHLAALANGTAGHALDWDDTALSSTPDRALLLHPTLPPLPRHWPSARSWGLPGGTSSRHFSQASRWSARSPRPSTPTTG